MPRKQKTFKICSFKLPINIYSQPPAKISTIDNEVTSGYLNVFLSPKKPIRRQGRFQTKHGRDHDLDFKYLYPPPMVDLNKQVTEVLPSFPKIIRRRRSMRSKRGTAKNKKKEEEMRKAQERKLMNQLHSEARMFG